MKKKTSFTKVGAREPGSAEGHDQGAKSYQSPETSRSRRSFLSQAAAVTIASGIIGAPPLSSSSDSPTTARAQTAEDRCEQGPLMGRARAEEARRLRVAAADYERNMPIPPHPCNGDEVRYENQNYFASYTKGLPHQQGLYGEVDPAAYKIYLEALASGKPDAFEQIPLGCGTGTDTNTDESNLAPPQAAVPQQRRLQNPQAGYNFDLEGKDYHQLISRPTFELPVPIVAFPPAFTFDSPEEAVEIAENYWQALTRDVPFVNYETDSLVQTAALDLNQFGEIYKGPRENGQVTPRLYSRGVLPGDAIGPFISQFLIRDVPYGAQTIDARIRTAATTKSNDFMTVFDEWLMIQNGCTPTRQTVPGASPLYIRNGRDLAEYVRNDATYQAYLNAALIMLTPTAQGGLGTPLDQNNPYNPNTGYRKQDNFVEFGPSQLLTLLGEVSVRAHKAVWYQKWQVHRRLRPEEFAARVHFWANGQARYPINPILYQSASLKYIQSAFGSLFLPQAFPEGSPLHPAYGAGHATLAGACVTILKAWFDESANPFRSARGAFVSSADGTTRLAYRRLDQALMSIGGGLNKLASNVSIGRNIAGVHWRSDYTESVYLGEQIAIQLLEDYGFTYNEDFAGFNLTDFNGNQRLVGAKRTS